MAGLPTKDLDNLNDREIVQLAEEVKESWKERDEVIEAAQNLRKQKWEVVVPPAWKQTALTRHTSLSKEIPARVVGTIAMQPFLFSRTAQDDDQGVEDDAVTVARFCQAFHQYNARHTLPGKNAYIFGLDQLTNKGAQCAGSIFAPHAWASVPATFTEGGDIAKSNWRDDKGQPTDDPERMDLAASARAYKRQVDEYRRQAKPPITRRVLPTEQSYPLFVDGEMLALFIIRKASLMEAGSRGYAIEQLGGNKNHTREHEIIEVITPNRCRYYWNKNPLVHPQWGAELVTNYGFVPYTYRVGLEGGEMEYGFYGTPLLDLVAENIRMIDTCLTYQYNAMHIASFTSFYIDYDMTNGQWNLVEGDTGRKLTTFDFKTGTIMDFGPGKTVKPFLHPGLNKDFDEFLKWQHEEVDRIIPRSLQGIAESSGYNTAQATTQAKAIFFPLADATEAVAEDLAAMDLHHISERVPGPVYLYLEQPRGQSSKPKKVGRISITRDNIGGDLPYYQISATLDRELDRVTLGQFALNMMNGGVGDDEWVWDMAGGQDYAQMRARRARQKVEDSPQMMAAIETRAIARFGMLGAVEDAKTAGRIQVGPDGTPMVRQADGSMAGPGQTTGQTPQGQGAAGAALGGMNAAANPGAPNLASQANPTQALPAPTPTGRSRGRRRGGALPGAPQRQPVRPTPQAGVV